VTLKDYIQTLPKERVDLAATDIDEAAKIEQEHAALPNAVLDTEDTGAEQPMEPSVEQTAPEQSFDINSDQDAANFIKGMEVSHPELVMKLRRDEKAWDEMLEVDRRNVARMNKDGGIKFTGDDQSDYDFYRWAYGRGMMQSDSSIENLISSFSRGLWQMAKGAVKVALKTPQTAANPAAAGEMAATVVDSAQAAVSEYQQLGAGLAALTAGDDPQVKMAAMYELAKFVDTEQKNHNAWRQSVSEGFAAIPVDQDSVEFLSEAFDISNLIGAGAGKLVTGGAKRVGLNATAEVLGKSRKVVNSEQFAQAMAKVPVVGTPYKRAILMGQVDNLSIDAQAAYAEVAAAQADLAAKRATLAASPASDPKDVLLKQIADGEADLATKQAAYNATQSQLDAARQGVSEALDLEGRGITNRVASGTLETAGNVVSGTGRLMTRAYRGASELLTGEADNAAFDMAADRLGGNLAGRGNIVTRIGNDISIAGRTMTESGASIPYFRRLRQAEDASKLTRGAAAFVDWSNLGWAADKTGDLLKAGAAGAPVSGGFGYIASGGDLAAAAESAGAGAAYGIGGGAYGQWEAYTDPRFRYDELLANRRQFRDTLSRRDINGQSQLKIFDQMDAGDQLAVSTYAQGKPDVAFRFVNDPKQASGYYDRDNNVVVINKASPTPVGDIFRHEVAHFVERHGLQAQVREMYLGDAEKGVIGQYTALDSDGNPLVVETTGPDGSTVRNFKLNAEGERLKAEYEGKIRSVDPTFSMSPEYFASELFAEQYADRLMGGNFRRDLSRNTVDNIVDSLASKPILKNFLGGIGLLFDQNDNIVGTGVFSDLKRNRSVEKLISRWESEAAKGKRTGIQDEVEQHVFTETELRDPAVATKWLQGGGAVRFGPDGKPVFDAKGTPQFLTEKEADALQRDLANEIITQIEKYVAENPGEADVIQRREIVDVNGVKRTVFSGKRIPAAVIDAIEGQNRFNPHQLAHLRAASATVEKNGVGAMIAHFYQAASRKLGGKAYKTVGGRWRRDGVVGFQVTKDGNVVLNTVSWEQLAENARKASRTKLARETYATAGIPVESAIMADVKTYLNNLVDGRPGATDIGETRRDFINNLLGIRMAANADANPLFETTDAPKTILTSLRLDRMNRMAPLDTVDVAWGPKQYRQAKANMRPDAGENLKKRPSSVRVLPSDLAFPKYMEGASGEGGSIRSANTAKKEETYKAQGLVPVAAGGVGEMWVKPEEAEFIKKSGFGRSHLNQTALHAYQVAKAGIDPEILRDDFVREMVDNLGRDAGYASNTFDALRNSAVQAASARPQGVQVYHGTDAEFDEIEPGKLGAWFSTDKKFTKAWGQRTVEAQVDLKNPYVIEDSGLHIASLDSPTEIRRLKKAGYDGVLVRTSDRPGIENYLVFDKSAIQYRPEAKRPTPREIEVVAQELGLENLDSGAKEFGGFMRQMRDKGITGRDVVKAYLITTSSVNRGAVKADSVRKVWPDLDNVGDTVRPEDAFAKLLGTPAGQRYLNAAVDGKFDEEAANEMLEKFKPFGLYNTQRELMRNAAETLAPMSDAIADAVENLPTEQYADFVREHFKGISYGKVGFMSGMLGRGDLPTVDTRQRQLHYGPDKINVDKRILLEVRDRLAQLEIPITEDMRPFYQTMVHHAVWDRLAGTDTTHADIKEAMLQFRPDTTQPKSEVAGFTPTKDVTNIPDISLEDLRGVKVFPILADLTAVGTYKGIDAAAVVPVDMFGGPNYPFIPENRDEGVVWANEGKGLGTRKTKLLQETDGYAIVVAMTQNTHVSNSTTVRAFINTLDAYVKDGRVKPAGIKKADRAIKGLGVSLPSVSDPAFGDAVRALSFDARSAVVGQLERAEFEEYGFPSAKRVIDAVRDPDFDGVDYGDGLLVVRLDPEDTVVKLGEQGTPKHPDYTYGVRGRVVGRLKRPLPSKLVFSEFFAERRAANASVPHDARAFSLKMPITEITDEKIAAAKRLETTVATNAQQMRAALAAATGSWQTSDVAVNKGGVGIADFVRALRDNEYAPSLTPYDESQVKEKVKAGQMRVFKLQNAEIYFALVRDGDKTVISSVVNNEPGARGIAAPAVLSKAIAAGATHLDCFAVTSQKYPNGFLPTLYSLFGFEQEGERVDFSQEMFDADWKAAGENPQKKFADLLRLWQRDGWNPTTPKPQVTFMRLRDDLTSNDSRQSYTRRLLETPTGELADRGRTTRRGVQPDAQSPSEGAGDRGAAGDNARPDRGAQGVGGRVSPAARGIDRFRELVRDLARLTDEDARVRGLDLNQLQALRAELAAVP
jgi:hypothetical protein